MNFFKSVFSDDPDPPQSESESASASQIPDNALQNKVQDGPDRYSSPIEHGSVVDSSPNASAAAGWNFGGLIRNLTVKSESIIETYRRDLQEFGTGLKKEIEVAHGSLETVGHTFDEFGNSLVKGTAQIISQGKDVILAIESDSDNNNINNQKFSGDKSSNSKAYSRFDAQVRAIQGDASTYCEEPEDLNDYNKWKLEFSLEGKQEEVESYLRENHDMESIYNELVPSSVDRETFWYRYYYKVSRLKKAEELRARLVRRASLDDEDLSWDFEDDDGEGFEFKAKSDLVNPKKVRDEVLEKSVDTELPVESSSAANDVGTNSNVEQGHYLGEESTVERRENSLRDEELGNNVDTIEESEVEKAEVVHQVDDGSNINIKEAAGESISEVQAAITENDSPTESDSKLMVERKSDDGKSSIKGNESSLVSSQHSAPEEDDLGWDEIEDLSSIEEKKTTQSGSPNKVDLMKRLSAAEEDEDLSWDIEEEDDDDDEKPAKP